MYRDVIKKGLNILLVLIMIVYMPICVMANEELDPFDYAEKVYEYIESNYKGEIDKEELANNLVKGITETLDQYSFTYNKEEMDAYMSNITGSYTGIGIGFSIVESRPKIINVFRHSPAERRGLVPNDVIMKIDGEDTYEMTADEAKAKIIGSEKSSVSLLIRRELVEEYIEIDVEREKIVLESVQYQVMEDDIGYIRIDQFIDGTFDATKEACLYFQNKHIRKVVLDLRNNPGGIVNQAVLVASLFVPEGRIVTLDFENPGYFDIHYTSSLKAKHFLVKVLVNENSASAAEILAAAIQDRNAGQIIGETTFGKGIIQSGSYLASYEKYKEIFDEEGIEAVTQTQFAHESKLLDESDFAGYFQITTGSYLTPNGRDIHHIGVIPDIDIEYEEKLYDVLNINRVSSYFNYDPGSTEIVVYNAKKILYWLGYDIEVFDGIMRDSFLEQLKLFQEENGLVSNKGLTNATRFVLDYYLYEIRLENDIQLREAINLFK